MSSPIANRWSCSATSLLGLYPVKLPEPARCVGGVLTFRQTAFRQPDDPRWRFGGGLPTLQSRLTLDVPGHYELDLRMEGRDARGPLVPFVDRRADRQRVTLAVESLGPESRARRCTCAQRVPMSLGLDSRRLPQGALIAWLDAVQDAKPP